MRNEISVGGIMDLANLQQWKEVKLSAIFIFVLYMSIIEYRNVSV